MVKRTAAMTSDGAPAVCAKRIRIEAVEVASIAMIRLMGSRMRERCAVMA
jgi:hypothetical protein